MRLMNRLCGIEKSTGPGGTDSFLEWECWATQALRRHKPDYLGHMADLGTRRAGLCRVPGRDIIFLFLGGKDGNPPSLATIFFETRKKSGQLEGDNTNKKYDEILEASQSQPQLSNIELIEKCFGTQCRQHVVCYGVV
uniref:Uncharacterized protein n=1 Tax=Ananas comosus var. bracteatus TaxID=296719 RepID=A0A6V7P9N2_ANACO|nr:unnamed protein product [Ananas comosus var. bracteatus]